MLDRDRIVSQLHSAYTVTVVEEIPSTNTALKELADSYLPEVAQRVEDFYQCYRNHWMAENKDKLKVGVMLGLGGSLDVYAGNVKRAPRWMIKMKLEWLYRLIKEPWRFSRMIKIPSVLVIAHREKKRRKKNG